MYEVLKTVLLIAMLGLGSFMAIFPKKAVKEEDRENEETVKKMRTSGLLMTIASLIFLVFIFVKKSMY